MSFSITVPGQPWPQGNPGPPGEQGKLAPVDPSSQPNTWTNKYLFRVAVGKIYQITIKAYLVRLDHVAKKSAVFERSLTIREDPASPGNAKLPFALEPIKADQKETGAGGMASASISQAIAPGDPSSVEITVSGPNATTCNIQVYIESDDGCDTV